MRLPESPVIFNPILTEDSYTTFSVTDLTLGINNRQAQIAAVIEEDGYSNISYAFNAFFETGEIMPLGKVLFSRSDSYTFGVPDTFFLYSGKPLYGAGIYLAVRICYGNQPDTVRFYELASTLDSWRLLSDGDFYIPTAFINGRGNLFVNGEADDFYIPAPAVFESENLLTSVIDCTFTADRHSYIFILPRLPDPSEKIRATYVSAEGDKTVWEIAAGSTHSAPQTVDETEVVMYCDRSSGKIIFYDGPATFPLPYAGRPNSLTFRYKTVSPDEALRVCSMSRSTTLAAFKGSGSASVTVFSGSRYYPHDLLWIDPVNPLYFPKSCSVSLPEPSGSVVALDSVKGKLLIFKPHTVFSAKVVSSEPYSIPDVLSGTRPPSSFSTPKLTLESVAGLGTTLLPRTLVKTEDKMLFCSESGEIFSLSSSLSCDKVGEVDGEPRFAVADGENYLVFTENSVFSVPIGKNLSFIPSFDLPVKVLNALSVRGNAFFLANNMSSSIYVFTLKDDCDRFLLGTLDPDEADSLPIETSVTISPFDNPEQARLHSVLAVIKADGYAELSVFADGEHFMTTEIFNGSNEVRLPAFLTDILFVISAKGKLEINDFAVFYTPRRNR